MRIRFVIVVLAIVAFGACPGARAVGMIDTDEDGLSDAAEIHFGTNPANTDTDGDGYPDGVEIAHGYDPRDQRPVKLPRRIEIDLRKQRLAYFLGPYQLGDFVVSTGKARTPTPKGAFHITAKRPRTWSAGAQLWMPWWLNFTGPNAPAGKYAIHELPEWRNGKKEGADHLGQRVSGGCVRLGIGPAKKLYDWAEIGTAVTVR